MQRIRIIMVVLILFIIMLLSGVLYINLLLSIITGYAAKNLSSGIFLANRTQESMEATDLNFSFIRFLKNSVSSRSKTVKSHFFWHTSHTTFVNGYGNVLVNDYPVNDIHTVTPLFGFVGKFRHDRLAHHGELDCGHHSLQGYICGDGRVARPAGCGKIR